MFNKALGVIGALVGLVGGTFVIGTAVGESGPVHAVSAKVDAQEKRVDELREDVRDAKSAAGEAATQAKLTQQAVEAWIQSERRAHGHE